ncbi:hypothetical protein [Hymenobacter elongatus]|uniref:DUF2116 family Zn-ribbon domain-containing protein n=1 Tax=Hymenobacter elongatus TaxID=877208 RepID=A0A4Z0PR21_9BACT|nr:hypothetical protein [Hymenobacter elongatus]TGE18673.1 hypothetical protein E5J99_05045 [Hymenobacter elongatus]
MNSSEKSCLICDNPLYGRADKTTCSDACRVRLHRQRQNDALAEIQEDKMPLSSQRHTPLDLPWLTQGLPPARPATVQTRWEQEPENQEEAADRKRTSEVALAKEMHQHYVKVVEPFLQKEQQRLSAPQLRRMLRFSIDAYEDYKQHPHLAEEGSRAQKCQKDLRGIISLLQDTLQEAKDSWLSDTGRYELNTKWRKQLRDRLLG